jgi:hypothetical protein
MGKKTAKDSELKNILWNKLTAQIYYFAIAILVFNKVIASDFQPFYLEKNHLNLLETHLHLF